MDNELFKNENPEIREKMLKDNCDQIVQDSYMKRLTPEELTSMKDSLSGIAIAINDLEEEKKELVAEIKTRLDPLKDEMRDKLTIIKNKAVLYKGDLFKFIDPKERMVGFYDSEGDLISSRTAMADELQGTFMQVLRGTGTSD